MKAFWTEHAHLNFNSSSELDDIINEVRRLPEPTMLFLESDVSSMLVLGIGAIESVLTYVDANGGTFHSVGDLKRTGVVKFRCREQLDEFLAEMAVPESVAIAAAHDFISSGDKPSNVQWEADW